MLTVGRVGAGTGCKYLTEQVAAGKDDFAEISPAQALAYYSDLDAHGESPGRWLGRGLATVGVSGTVNATELENLIGKARYPHYDEMLRTHAIALLNDRSLTVDERRRALTAAEKGLYLGRGFATYESAADRAERAVADLGEDADEASRDAIRAQVLAEGDRQAVAAYELTFTPVKSVSVLAAIGGETVWQKVLDAHRAAVNTALEYVQDHASYSRAGVNGVRQIDTNGLVIAAFEHRMSRDQDPNIHTHAIVANRVQCADGKWRTVDGRAVYAASVGARATYEQALEIELAQRLGARFSVDERRTIREVHGIPAEVIELFSKRRSAIENAMTSAIGDDRSGGHLSTDGWRRLARRFTLSTRERKTGAEPTGDAITRWQREAVQHGHDPDALLLAVTRPALRERRPRTDQQILAEAVGVLDQTRAVWTRHHAVLAVSRVLPPQPEGDLAEHQAHVEQLVNRLLAESVQVTPPDMLSVGSTLRRDSDGQSVFTAHADVLYAARSTVAAEQRILTALEEADAPLITATELAASVARVPLGDDQDVAVHSVLTSGSRVSAIVGPAGSGKTYVQRAITAAWKARDGTSADTASAAPGYRDVLALAPSQIVASVLSDSIGARAENVAKWLHEHRRQARNAAAARRGAHVPDPAWTLRAGQLVILDEAGMVATRELDALVTAVRKAGAKLLLVGDDKQLGAVGAGGMFATIVDRTDAPVLSTVRRFTDEHGSRRQWECAASLGLRNRELDAIAEYERRGRIHSGPLARMQETSYRAWLTDHLAFQQATHGSSETTVGVALLMADTEDAASALSGRARADLVRRGAVEAHGVVLADGNRAGVGDLIVTRLNERRLRAEAGEGFVANRDTWRVTERGRDGSLTVASVTSIGPDGAPRVLRLPASYVSVNVQLAYAGTVHSAQGRTVTTARGLVTDATSAQALYVMMSRGQRSNEAYVVTDDPERETHQQWPEQHHLSVLAAILERDDRPSASVTDVGRDLDDESSSIKRLRVIFGDLSTVVRGGAYEQIIAEHAGRDAADRAITDPAWATLVRALGTAQMRGWDSRLLLIAAITQRELGTAADVAAVLHWRCENITEHWREAPHGPSAAATTGSGSSWVERARGILDAARDDSLAHPVAADAAQALIQVAEAMDRRGDTLALQLADHAAAGQAGGYDNRTVPLWLRALGPVPTSGRNVQARCEAWLTRARDVAIYQDAVDHEPTVVLTRDDDEPTADAVPQGSDADPIGPRPPAGDAEARDLWDAARLALAAAPAAAAMRAMLPHRLNGWVAEGLVTETRDQPSYVGHDLRALSLRARAQRTRVARLRQEVITAHGMLSAAQGRRWRRNNDAIASLERTHGHLTGRLERAETSLREIERDLRTATDMHQDWQQWEQSTRETRTRARLAAQELGLRRLEVIADASGQMPPPTPIESLPVPAGALASRVNPALVALPSTSTSAAPLEQQYAIQWAAAEWFCSHLEYRWAADYLDKRGLTEPAAAAHVGYAPSRPGQWTLLLDHLRALGYDDTAIETAGLVTRSRRGDLIDRFRDRIVLPILDGANRPIGFLGRKPASDTNPDNPKYLNPTSTPLYDKARVLYGLDADAIARLANGARAILVEGPMDRLAVQLAAPDLVPLATCGTALTDTHLDVLAGHTPLNRLILGFDSDPAGRKATLAAGRKLASRAVPAFHVEVVTADAGSDPAAMLEASGPERVAAALTGSDARTTLLDLLVDERLDRYDWPTQTVPLRDLPIATHAGYDATRFVGETVREALGTGEVDPHQIQRQLLHIAERTGTSPQELNAYLVTAIFPADEREESEPYAGAAEDDQAMQRATWAERDADVLSETELGRETF